MYHGKFSTKKLRKALRILNWIIPLNTSIVFASGHENQRTFITVTNFELLIIILAASWQYLL